MDNQDKIINKIKNAAHQAEHKDFAEMEKVWAKIDQKLDQHTLQTKTKVWKKIAIAASVLLVISIGYQFLKSLDKKPIYNETIVTKEAISPKTETAVTHTIDTGQISKTFKEVKKNIVAIENQGEITPSEIAIRDSLISAIANEKIIYQRAKKVKTVGRFFGAPVYDAIEVVSVSKKQEEKEAVSEIKLAAPLVVVDGKVIASNQYNGTKDAKKVILNNLKEEENVEKLIILEKPLYIINGVEYDEESLFGKKPTSPYAPLNEQKIETIEIFEEEEAVAKFGEKGENGVVIITTKNGIPLKK